MLELSPEQLAARAGLTALAGRRGGKRNPTTALVAEDAPTVETVVDNWMSSVDPSAMPTDLPALVITQGWLEVLAAPHVYRALQRPVEPGYLTRLLDLWIAYVDRGDTYMGTLPAEFARPDPKRPALARKLRALLQVWVPPDLPAEITKAARALLAAEGFKKPNVGRGTSWDDFAFSLDEGQSLESILIWPEGLAAILPKDETT
jgi:hypothetical protein